MEKVIKNNVEYYTYPKLRESQLLQLSLLKIVDQICNKNNLQYWIDSGTLLGAIREKGFIPWDDDLDICLLKNDYDKLLPLLLLECKTNDKLFLKYYKKEKSQSYVEYFASTKMVLKETDGSLSPCNIDIFQMKIIEYSTESKLKDRENTDTAYFFMHGNYRYNTKKHNYKIDSIKEAQTAKKDFFAYYNNEYMKQNMSLADKSKYLISYSYGSILLRKEYNYYKYNDVFPLVKTNFEGFSTYIPNNYNAYLTNLYGNYMQLPKLEQRVPFNIEALSIKPNNRNLVKSNYLKKAQAENLTYYFNSKKLGKYKLVLYYFKEIGILSTLKGLKILKTFKKLTNQPVFQRVFINSK